MISHSYLLLGAAAVWIVINFLGAAFTIRRNHLRGRRRKHRSPPTAAPSRSIKNNLTRYRVCSKGQR